MHPTDYSFRLYDENTFLHLSLQNSWVHTNIGLTMASKFSLYNSIFFAHLYISEATHHQTYTKFLQHTKPKKLHFRQLQIHITVYNDKYVHA